MVSASVSLAAAGPAPAPPRWPALRDELELHHGPALPDGQPSWTVHDPVRHRFVRIDWVTYEVLRRWWLAAPDAIAEQVNQQTTLTIGAAYVQRVLEFARRHELVQPSGPAQRLPDDASAPRRLGTWLLHHYLFFRVPLCNPDRWLQRLLPWVARLGSAAFARATLLALAVAVLAVWRDWERFSSQAVDLLSWRGLALYGLTLVAVKAAHEFGHAFVARRHGCRVPTMGLAFMVLWPVAYTDTSEVWRLADSRARLQVALAGVRTELTIAAWATLAWVVLPEGGWSTAAFILGTLTWLSTLLVNLSPFMRFDGYFALCDALDQPNLHERSFALARWWLRRLLLGWQAPAPEALRPGPRRAMVGFAFVTWAYRLALYLGIAWLVYQFAIKAVGVLLFAVELGFFILLPVWREMKIWHLGRVQWRATRRARAWLWLAPALLALGFVPIASHESAGAVLQPADHLALRLPATAVLRTVHRQPGERLAAGAVLLEATSPALEQRIAATRVRIRQLQAQVAAASIDAAQQAQWGSLQQALAAARDEAAGAAQELARLTPVAPFAGQVLDVDDTAKPGSVVNPQQVLLQFASPGRWRIVAYASEQAVHDLRTGDAARFVADADPLRPLPARLVSIAPHPSAWLAEPVLAQSHGGPVDASLRGGHWHIAQPLYRVEIEPLQPPALSLRQWRGHVVLAQPSRSAWERTATAVGQVLARELGF